MPDPVMTEAEIIRRLRLVCSQRVRHRPLTIAAIADLAYLHRRTIYDYLEGLERMSDDVRARLSWVLAEVDVQAIASCRGDAYQPDPECRCGRCESLRALPPGALWHTAVKPSP